MSILEIAALILGFLSLLAGICLNIKFPPGILGGIFWIPKLLAGAWSPFLAFAGILGATAGLISQNYLAAVAGLLGAILEYRHITLVTVDTDHFSRVFGPDWESRTNPSREVKNIRKRYQLIQPQAPEARGILDLDLKAGGESNRPLYADLWGPPEGIPRSGLAIMYFHGGAWQAMDKGILTQPLFRRLANQGHVILDVAYPLAPEADLNQMLVEVKLAILWMKDHAREYSANPERIVLMGVSGGAHLALLAAYTPDHPAFQQFAPGADMTVCAVISMFGVTDMAAFFKEYGNTTKKQPGFSSQITPDLLPRIHGRTWLDRFMTRSRAFPAYRYGNMPGGALLLVGLMGGTLNEIPEKYHLASPISHIGLHCPPTLQIFDDNDFIIDASHGRLLHKTLCEAGARSVYIEYPQTVHGFDQYFGVSRRISPSAQSATYEIERFLALMV
jgi:acetyl esterase/lipase